MPSSGAAVAATETSEPAGVSEMERQTERKTDRKRERGGQTERERGGDRQRWRPTDRQRGRQTEGYRQRGRQTDREGDKQTEGYRQTERETDRQKGRQKDRQACSVADQCLIISSCFEWSQPPQQIPLSFLETQLRQLYDLPHSDISQELTHVTATPPRPLMFVRRPDSIGTTSSIPALLPVDANGYLSPVCC